MSKKRIVVLGAGYGGLMTVTRLQRELGVNEADITLVNKNDYHYETTWLHEAAAGTLDYQKVCYPIADVIDNNKVKFVQDTVVKVNPIEKTVTLGNGEVSYDYLVLSLGFEPETFGIPGLKEHAFSIANIESVRKIRKHIEEQFMNYQKDDEKKDETLTFVVGGAGFTGIEFLGELVNRIPKLCEKHNIEREKVKVFCIEAAPTALPGFDPTLVEYAVRQLEKKGVEFLIGTAIKGCTPTGIIVAKGENEEEIKSNTVIWAAGVRGSHIVDDSGFDAVRGKVKVDNFLRVLEHEEVFVVGDCSFLIDETNNRPYPPTAQVAMQQGENCAKNLLAIIRNKGELKPFKFDNKGAVCSLGHDDAIGTPFGHKVTGFPASVLKKMVDNRALFMIGGPSLVLKKGKFKFFG